MGRFGVCVLTSFLVSACADLPHEAPFDPATPAAHQAKCLIRGALVVGDRADGGGVLVELRDGGRTFTVQTASDGTFEFDGLAQGSYALRATEPLFEELTVTGIVVSLGSAVDLGTLTLEPLRSVVIGNALVQRIVNNQFSETGGVTLVLEDAGGRGVVTTTSLANGVYQISGVPSGTYAVVASFAGSTPVTAATLEVAGERFLTAPDVVLDFAGPDDPAVEIMADIVSSPTLPLELSASGAREVELSQDVSFLLPARMAYAAQLQYTLTGGDGAHTVYARFIDADGNYSPVVMDEVTVDTQPPTGAGFTVAEAPLTPLLTWHLLLTAVDADEMQVAEGACGGLWVPFAPAAAYDVKDTIDGKKVIAVRFRDVAGNQTPCYTQAVTLDTTAPLITSMSPRSGPAGRAVIINGINFGSTQGDAVLRFADVAAPILSWSNTELQAVVPSGVEPGRQSVEVEADGKSSAKVSFTILPEIRSLAPNAAATTVFVDLNGSNFGAAAGQVRVDGIVAAAASWASGTVRIEVPAALAAGTRPVVVTQNGVDSNALMLNVRPHIDAVVPPSGGSGATITLNGRTFGPAQGMSTVSIGEALASVVSWSDTSIQAQVPVGLGAGALSVYVVVNGQQSNSIAYDLAAPVIYARYPSWGTAYTEVTLYGQNLGDYLGDLRVGGEPANIGIWTSTQIVLRIPENVSGGTQPIVIAKTCQSWPCPSPGAGSSNVLPFTHKGSDVWITDDYPALRERAPAVWTGREMIVWGGLSPSSAELNTGWRYNPVSDTWLRLPVSGAPAARSRHVAVWSGTEMIIWGGDGKNNTLYRNGGRYSPSTDTWTPVKVTGAPSTRTQFAAVWDGDEMIVWGGYHEDAGGNYAYLNTGARYNPQTDAWTPMSGVAAPVGRASHTAVWTGTEMFVWGGYYWDDNQGIYVYVADGGRYDPAANTWRGVTSAGEPAPREGNSLVWTGSEVVVWGGYFFDDLTYDETYFGDGARYNPATDAWTAMTATGAPAGRYRHSTVWTGSEMIVWGGFYYDPYWGEDRAYDGARYDPAMDRWVATDTYTAPSARGFHSAVWTGNEMIVFGGNGLFDGDEGAARYDPALDTWSQIQTVNPDTPAARQFHSAVWTGSEMIVWGGDNGDYEVLAAGARYAPATDTWLPVSQSGAPEARKHHTAVWDGSGMIIWGGEDDYDYLSTGGRYDPAADTWSATADDLTTPLARSEHTAVWTGSEMIVWGGYTNSSRTNTGGLYDPVADVWRDVATSGAPDSRYKHTAVFTGDEMIVWGGSNGGYANTGGRYAPLTDAWTATATLAAPAGRYNHSAVWTGSQMIVWGGYAAGDRERSGGRYDPVADTWSATPTAGAPAAREEHVAVWTGSAMVIFGGSAGFSNVLSDGAKFEPAAGTWSPLTSDGYVAARYGHKAVWTGSEMLVFGGYYRSVIQGWGIYLP